jgi:YfiH family protein
LAAPRPRATTGLERRTAHGIRFLISPGLESAGVLAAWTERSGGRSTAPFASLNLSASIGDHPARVGENRDLVRRAISVPPWAQPRQVHGADVVVITPERSGAGFAGPPVAEADALVTTSSRVSVAVLTADCLPIVLAAPGRLAVVHAGWRGLAAGVLAAALQAFPQGATRAAIGPAVGPCHYRVGEEVVEALGAVGPDGPVVDRRSNGPFVDLAATAEAALRGAGVAHIDRAGECTACEEERFFSHRRDGSTGRQGLVAMLL